MTWGAVGAAAVSVGANYLNSKSASKNSSSGGQSGFDPTIQAGEKQAVQTAESVANQPWTGFDVDQAVAGLTPNQLAAQSAAETGGQYIGQYQQTAAQQFDPATLNKYSNPYTTNVLDAENAMASRNYATQVAGLNAKQGMTSAFGGDRSAIAQNELTTNFNLQADVRNKQGLSDAYNAGVSAFNQDRNFAAGQAGQAEGALASTGAVAQATNQNRANFNYNQFKEQRDWTKNQNAYLTQTLAQVPKGSYYSGNQQTTTTPAGGGWGGALSGAASILGKGGFGGGSSGGGAASPDQGALNAANSDNNYQATDPNAGQSYDPSMDTGYAFGGPTLAQ
jgi:hypothetical protein